MEFSSPGRASGLEEIIEGVEGVNPTIESSRAAQVAHLAGLVWPSDRRAGTPARSQRESHTPPGLFRRGGIRRLDC